MLCEICKRNEATFFIKEVILGETKTHSLCENCAKRYKETILPSNMQIEKLIESLISFANDDNEKEETKKITKKQKDKKCPKCLSTYEEVILSKVAGCPYCYKTFKKDIEELINKVSKDISYNGKKPDSILKPKKIKETKEEKLDKLREYKKELNHAIEIEDYEKAAKLRDMIYEIENKKTSQVKKESVKKTNTKKVASKKTNTTNKAKKKSVKKNDNSK